MPPLAWLSTSSVHDWLVIFIEEKRDLQYISLGRLQDSGIDSVGMWRYMTLAHASVVRAVLVQRDLNLHIDHVFLACPGRILTRLWYCFVYLRSCGGYHIEVEDHIDSLNIAVCGFGPFKAGRL